MVVSFHETEHVLSNDGHRQMREGIWDFQNRNNDEDKNTHASLVPHGLGRMTFVGLQGAYICEGMFKNGIADGYVRWIWDDGTIY
jgi:hypothetical protein